jgi:hypothetical protein
MICVACSREMRVAMVEEDQKLVMRGFAFRTFRCEYCGNADRKLVFDPQVKLRRFWAAQRAPGSMYDSESNPGSATHRS